MLAGLFGRSVTRLAATIFCQFHAFSGKEVQIGHRCAVNRPVGYFATPGSVYLLVLPGSLTASKVANSTL